MYIYIGHSDEGYHLQGGEGNQAGKSHPTNLPSGKERDDHPNKKFLF